MKKSSFIKTTSGRRLLVVFFMKTKISLLLILVPAIAHADPVKDRLDVLETTIQSFQADSVSRNAAVASALATIDQLKQEYQTVHGTMDSYDHTIQQQAVEITRLKRDLADRLSAIEERLEIYDQQITKAVAKVLPQAASEAEGYQKALDLVQKSDFLTAVASFRTFLKTYPKSDFADNAQYWIGECYYAQKDFQKAIKEFQILVDKYPKSDKAPGGILKQGFSFAELGMTDEAKIFLNSVIKVYPGSDEAARALEKIGRLNQKDAGNAAPTPTTTTSSDGIPLAPGVKNQPKPAAEEPRQIFPKGKD